MKGRIQIAYVNFGTKEVSFFFESVIRLLNMMEKETERIEKRILLEEKALNSGKSDAFHEFVEAWLKEVARNDEMIQAYRKVLRENGYLLNKVEELRRKKNMHAVEAIGGAIGIGTAAGVSIAGGVAIVAVVGSIFALRNHIINLQPVFKYQFVEDQRDYNMLKKLNKINK